MIVFYGRMESPAKYRAFSKTLQVAISCEGICFTFVYIPVKGRKVAGERKRFFISTTQVSLTW
jgi:hypothetical protein